MVYQKFAGLVSVIAVLCATSGTASVAQGGTRKTSEAPKKPAPDISFLLKTDKKTYKPDEIMTLTLTTKNISKQPVKLVFVTGQRYDIEIRQGVKPDGVKVWQWANGMMFTQMITSETLASGKSISFTEKYDPAKIKPLAPGTYTVTATFKSSVKAAATAKIVIK